MANIIKIPCGQTQGQNLLPFSDISNIKTYCTPHNFTYSMNSDNEWGEYTPNTPSWATTNYWMDENLVPNSASPSWSLTNNGTTVHLYWGHNSDGRGIITHNTGLLEFTCYIVGKISDGEGTRNKSLLWLASDTYGPDDPPAYDTFHKMDLFNHSDNQIGITYFYGATTASGSRRITPDSNRNYHIFAFKWRYVSGGCPCTLNVDGTSDSFQIPSSSKVYKSYFPASATGSAAPISEWDIKLIAFLNVAESDEVIANNVNVLRMIYQ